MNGRETLEFLKTVLEAGHYDIVFVESSGRAYSQVRYLDELTVL